jgi:hypothetical protein
MELIDETGGSAMDAKIGDRIVIPGHHVGEPERACEILEVHGSDGGPPYLVRWTTDGHETIFFPGTDASVAPSNA